MKFLINKCKILILYASITGYCKLQENPPVPQREHLALQNITFTQFFVGHFAFLDSNSHTQLNPYSVRIRI